MDVGVESYEALALSEPEMMWELHDGQVKSKARILTFGHGLPMENLDLQLKAQLDPVQFRVKVNHARTQRVVNWMFVPDVVVIPTALIRKGVEERIHRMEVYHDPLPLVVEVWSSSTGDYDVDTKLPEYQRRGDIEIWRIQPYERTLTVWHRQPDGTYHESLHTTGTIELLALPGIVVNIDQLFVV